MKNIVANDSLVLQPGQLISVTSAAAQLMRIDCGCVWVTIEGDAYDHWLFGGDSLVLVPARHVVIEADKVFSRIDFLPTAQPVELPATQVMPSDDHHLAVADLTVAGLTQNTLFK